MANVAVFAGQSLAEIAEYHNDVVDSLKLFLRSDYQENDPRFVSLTPEEFRERLNSLRIDRIEETEVRSTFAVLAAMEAALRVDYVLRAVQKRKDDLSRAFRGVYKKRQERVRLEDLLDLWAEHHPQLKRYVSELRAALNFRHWMAHGRYWQRPTNGRFDYASIYDLAEALMRFPLYRN